LVDEYGSERLLKVQTLGFELDERPLGASHVPGGLHCKGTLLSYYLGQSPWNRQEHSGSLARQPSSLRYDPYGAMGLTPLLGLLEFLQVPKSLTSFPALLCMALCVCVTAFFSLRWIQEYVIFTYFASRETQREGVKMAVLDQALNGGLEKDVAKNVISENLGEKLDAAREHFEKAFRGQALSTAVLTELDAVNKLITDRPSGKKPLVTLSQKLREGSDRILLLAKRYEKCLSQELYKSLNSYSRTLDEWANACKAVSSMPKQLCPNMTGNTIRKWLAGIEVFAQIIDEEITTIPSEIIEFIKDLSDHSLMATEQSGWETIQKEKYRKQIRYTSSFIAQKIKQLEAEKSEASIETLTSSWKLVIGKEPYADLLKKGQNKIHSLREMYYGEEKEAREQAETIEYLQRELGKA
jgi:hypothetical protein